MTDLTHNRRNFEREELTLVAKCSLNNHRDPGQDCLIINLSRTGLALAFPKQADLNSSSNISVNIALPQRVSGIQLHGIIRRIANDKETCGIELNEILDKKTFDMLYATYLLTGSMDDIPAEA
ncbi:MAG: PilZ domain-containing protein [Deltaproteobacteria bacterium]|nr:PilZ domain-containing protein [Deltaproteobacteria bacterium]